MGKKPMKLSTRWFVGNEDDAIQIAEWFHGEGEIGNWNYEENYEKIRNAVVGTPKKGVTAMVQWCLEKRAEAEPEDPFVAAIAFDEWARRMKFGSYADLDEEDEVFDEVKVS